MNNTAIKMSAEVVREFKEAHDSLDLLKVFLITGATDISKSYEMIQRWYKGAESDAERANFTLALKSLQNIELKRVQLTEIIYNSGNTSSVEETAEEPNNQEEGAKTIVMLPKLETILDRVRTILTNGANSAEAYKESMDILTTSVGQGKAVNADNKSVLWDTEEINKFLDSISPVPAEDESTETTQSAEEHEKVGFLTIYNVAQDLIKDGKNADAIKAFLETYLIGKIIETKESNFFIKDKAVYEDYYSRILNIMILAGITERDKKVSESETISLKDKVEKEIEAEIKPVLEEMDKKETETSFANVTKLVKNIYAKSNFKTSLSDSLLKAQELAEKWAPNLLNRYRNRNETFTPVKPVIVSEPDIYDNSHNIRESNKELWAEVEKYAYLDELFKKAEELCLKGNWKDALSMSIILISSGQIKETKDATEQIKWEEDQIVSWFKTNVLSVTKKQETTQVTEEKKIGPVPPVNFAKETSEGLSRVLKDSDKWAGTCTFKEFKIFTDHHANKVMTFQILDKHTDAEKDLLITEENMTKFIDDLRNKLIDTRNNFPECKTTFRDTMSVYYELAPNEVKHVIRKLSDEADVARKELKKATQLAQEKVETTTVDTQTESVEPSTNDISNDAEGTVYYVEFKIGEPIYEKVDGKEVPVEDGTFVIANEKGIDCNVTVTDGIITNIVELIEESEPKEELPVPGDTENVGIVSDGTDVALKNEASVETTPLTEATVETSKVETAEENSSEETQATSAIEATVGEPSTNSNSKAYEGFESLLKCKDKISTHKEMISKAKEYANVEDGIKALYDVINLARRDNRHKKAFVRNWKGTLEVDLLERIRRIVNAGLGLTPTPTE